MEQEWGSYTGVFVNIDYTLYHSILLGIVYVSHNWYHPRNTNRNNFRSKKISETLAEPDRVDLQQVIGVNIQYQSWPADLGWFGLVWVYEQDFQLV